MNTIRYLILLAVLTSCATQNKSLIEAKARQRINSLDQAAQDNIKMLIEMIEEQSLVTDPGGKRHIPYEFRISLDPRERKKVFRIDPSLSFTARTDTYQCIGENATKEKVLQLVALPFTHRIKFCPYE